jgi:hypothetical protein
VSPQSRHVRVRVQSVYYQSTRQFPSHYSTTITSNHELFALVEQRITAMFFWWMDRHWQLKVSEAKRENARNGEKFGLLATRLTAYHPFVG